MNTFRRILIFKIFQGIRIWKYWFLSSCKRVIGKPLINIPVELMGAGQIVFKGCVKLGVYPSPYFFNGTIYLEARKDSSYIEINDGVWINNNTIMISEGEGIVIGKNTLIGTNVEIYDSDFHGLEPDKRMTSKAIVTAQVNIEENVFIGSNSKILKGVTIGRHSVIGHGSIVTKSIPENVIAAGIPAKVIRHF
jgi:acetyltransferase-like isoleucine patch superfamily enzyme